MKRKLFYIIMILVFVFSLTSAASAQQGGLSPVPGSITPGSSYSVELNKESKPAAPAQPQSRAAQAASQFRVVPLIVAFDSTVNAQQLAAATGGTVTHTFSKIFNGASLVVPSQNVTALQSYPGVTKVVVDELRQPQTDVTPGFIGAPAVWTQLGGQESAGEGVLVGMLDTGIWPEHPSFSDPDPSGKPYSPPSGGPYSCDFGNTAWNPSDVPFTCNNKLVGAYEFLSTYKAVIGLLPEEFDSARDSEGHGTHTSSTAAGNSGVDASIFGVDRGVISGIAPRAQVIMYRVCANQGCYSSDLAAAVEQAITDGVNVINFSISGGSSPFSDAVSLAFLDAYNAGVFVAASAGNSGPGADTTDHREPWVATVAASTGPRAFQTTATISGGGASLALTGTSLTSAGGPAPVYVSATDPLCLTPYAPGSVTGMIVVCERGNNGRIEKGYNVSVGGAAGMILYNQSAAVTDEESDNHFLPAVQIQFSQGTDLLAFLAAHPGATASWPSGAAVPAQGDVMASFSSRGGPGQILGVSKPDITAPGVQILAGMTPEPLVPPVTADNGPAGELFQAIAGTSMSSPHIAGSGALLKALHPSWTPGQIKSAIMTTAYGGVVKEDGSTPADAFDDGSGRVDLNVAGNPGLTFDSSGADYVAMADELWNANYPSLYVPSMPGKITVSRTVHSVLSTPSLWTTWVDAPLDVKVNAPKLFKVPAGGNYTFNISVDGSTIPLGETRFATLYMRTYWGKNMTPITVKFPITFVRKEPVVTTLKNCDPADLVGLKSTTDCTINLTNTAFTDGSFSLTDTLPKQLVLVNGSLTGGTQVTNRMITASGSIPAAQAPIVSIAPGVSPAGGYLPLSLFGIAPIAGVGDETITNFSVPPYVFAGETYTSIGLVSDGYAVVGGGTGADVQFINQSLPDPNPPNNVLAPFWTDLNPGVGGAMRIATLTDGVSTWLVIDYDAVKEYSTANTTTFEIWIGVNGVEDISYAYGLVTGNGDIGLLTVGAENKFGNSGQNSYYNGTGTLPAEGDQLVVSSIPGQAGAATPVTYQARAVQTGAWKNCVELTSSLFQGTSVTCFNGTVTADPVRGVSKTASRGIDLPAPHRNR